MDSTKLLVQATIGPVGTSNDGDYSCIECKTATSDFKEWYVWTIQFRESPCSSSLSSPSAAASTTLTLDTTTTTQIIYPASSTGFTWDSYFSNTLTSTCALSSCKIYDQSTCSTEVTSPISMASSSPWAVTAQKNALAGYSQTICVKCTNGFQEVSKDWTVSLSACQSCLTNPSSSVESVTKSYDSSSTPVKIHPTLLASDFTTWANYFPNSRSSDCALTSCSLYQSGCATALSGSEITIDSASPWDVKMLRNVPAGYTYTICVKCTNGHQYVEINNWSVTLNEANCYNVFTYTTGQSTSYDSGTLTWSATSSSQVIRPTNSAWTSWDSYFDMWHTADCAITSCSLYEVGCLTALTSTTHITIGGSPQWDVTASKSAAAIAGYSVTFCVKCTNGLQTVQQDNWSVALPDCQNKLTVPEAAASSGPLTYSDTDGATIEIKPSSTFTNWNDYFGYSGGDCGITSCSLFSQGCTTALSDPVAMDPTTFQVNAQLKKPSGYTQSMCIQCTNGAQTVQKDSWTVTLPACDSVLSNPASLPSPIVIPYANNATNVEITPITPWVSFDSYFNSNPTNCPLTNCHFREEGCSQGLSNYLMNTQGAYLIGISSIDPQSNPTMTAVQNWPGGYSYKLCIFCKNGATNNYLRWWEVSQTACDDVLTAPTGSYSSNFAYDSTAGSVETVTPSASFTNWGDFFGATDCPITTCSIAETNGGSLNYVSMDATTFAVTANKDVVAGYSEQVTVTCSNGATSQLYASWTVQQRKRCHNAFQYPTGPVASVDSGTLLWSLSTTSQVIEPQSSFTDYDTFFGSQSASATCKISACFLFEAGCSTALPATSPVSISSQSVSAKRDVTAGYTETFCIKCRYNSVDFVQQDQWQVAQSTCLNTLNPSPPAADTLTIGYDSTTPAEIKPAISFTGWNAFYSLSNSHCPIVDCSLKQQGCVNNLASPESTYITIDASTPWKIYAKTDYGFGYTINFCVKCNNGAQFVQIDNWAVTLTRCDDVLTPPTSAYQTSISYSSVNTWTNVFPADTTTTWEVFFSNSKPTLCPITQCNYKYIDSSGALMNGGITAYVEMDSSTWVVKAKVDITSGYSRLIRIQCCNGATCGTYDKWTIQQTYCQSNGLSVPGGSIPDSNLKFDATTTTEIVYPQSATWPTDHWNTFFSNPDISNCPLTSCSIHQNDCSSSLTSLDPTIIPTITSGSPFDVVAKKNVPAGYSITICVKCQNGYQIIQKSGWKIVQQGCDSISTPSSLSPETYIEYDTSNQISLQVTPVTPWVSWDSFFDNQNIADCIITTCQIYGSDCSSPVSGSYITMASSTPWTVSMERNVASGYSIDVCVKCGNTAVFAEDIWKITLGINACKIYHANGVSNQTFIFKVNETVAIDQSTIDSWFSVEDGNPSSPVCQITHYSVKTDQACTTYYTGSDGTFDNTSGQYILTLDTSQPTEQRNVFMCVKHRVNHEEQYVQLFYQVCGLEQLSLKTSSEFLIKSFAVDSGMKEITKAYFENKFESSIPECPVVSYKLVQKNQNTNQFEDYKGKDLEMNSADFKIKVNTSGSGTIQAYIEASSLDSESKAYLPMQIFLTNTPPTFTQEVVAIQVELTPQAQLASAESSETSESETQAPAQSYIFQIPDLKDEEQADEDITLSIDGLKEWMQYSEAEQSITFNDITAEKIGVYNIQFTLKDSFGAENIIVTTFEVKLPVVEEASEESSEQTQEEQIVASQEAALTAAFPGVDLTKFDKSTTLEQLKVLTSLKVDEETDILKGKIQRISEFGVTQIDFNKYLRSEFKNDGQVVFNSSNINTHVLDVYVQPALDRHRSPGFNMSTLNLTWNVSSFEKNQLNLQINFSEPASISPLLEQDELVVAFKQPYWFYSDVLKKSLEKEFYVMRKKIRKQMANTAFNKGFSEKSEQTEDAMKWVLILSFFMNVFMTGESTIYFIGWINAMQMIMHLPMLKPVLPANVLKVMTNILPIVSFDLIESEYSTDLIFDFEDPDNKFYKDFSDTVFGQMQDIGYESHNSIKILGSLFIFKMVFFLRLFVQLPLIWVYTKLTNSGKDKITELKKQLFWGEVLVLCLEGYIELLIAGYLNFEFYLNSTNGEVTARWVAFYCLLVSLIIMPAVIIYVVNQKPERVKQEAFYEKWGVMYDDIKTENRWQYATYGVFMLRRFIFVTLCFYLQQPSMQILGVNALNLFMLIYTGKVRAQQRRFRNRLDIFNEICISVISWHLMFFANEDYLPDPSMQYTMGWSMAIGIGINIIVNFTIIFAAGCKTIYLTFQKFRNLWRFAIYGEDPNCPLQFSSEEDVNQTDKKSKKDELSLKDIEKVTEEEPMNEEEKKDLQRREFSLKLAKMVEKWDADSERRKRERENSPKFGQPDKMIPLADELQDIYKSYKVDKKKKKVDPFEELQMRWEKEYKEIQVYEDRIKVVDDLSAKLKKIPIYDPQRKEIRTKLFEIRDEMFSSKVPESEAVKDKWIELRSNVNMATITLRRPKPVEEVKQSDTMKIMGDYMLDSARNNKFMPLSKKDRLIREEKEMRAKAAEAWKKYQQR